MSLWSDPRLYTVRLVSPGHWKTVEKHFPSRIKQPTFEYKTVNCRRMTIIHRIQQYLITKVSTRKDISTSFAGRATAFTPKCIIEENRPADSFLREVRLSCHSAEIPDQAQSRRHTEGTLDYYYSGITPLTAARWDGGVSDVYRQPPSAGFHTISRTVSAVRCPNLRVGRQFLPNFRNYINPGAVLQPETMMLVIYSENERNGIMYDS
ncbi:hypothetical protein FB451DRAFT_1452029 [Mycena latifolia]|nr:hypothetical protein FB451DRAFT_1452029 [Mycena latifolia]